MMKHPVRRVAVTLLFASAIALGQSTQPSTSAWPATSERLATALVNGDASGARAVAPDPASIVRAGTNETVELATLVSRATGGAVLATHAYSFPPLAMAADLAADFKTSPAIADDAKALMIPDDDDAMKRANATAVQWLGHALGANQGTPVAVAVVLPPATDGSSKAPSPVLILMKGVEETDGTYRVSRVVYGTLAQIVE